MKDQPHSNSQLFFVMNGLSTYYLRYCRSLFVTMDAMTDVSGMLEAIHNGDEQAAEKLLPLVYDELRRLAKSKMAHERDGHSLQPTALVHEAYMRLVGSKEFQNWNSKGHFFAAASEAMRRILIEHARRRQTLRRGGDRVRVDIEKIDLGDPNDCQFLIDLDRSLDQLEKEKPEIGQVVRLRFFGGLSIDEAANAMQLSIRTVNRHWAFAKSWLYKELSGDRKSCSE